MPSPTLVQGLGFADSDLYGTIASEFMNVYDLVVVLDPTVEQAQAEEKLRGLVTQEGLKVSEIAWWGKKDLAYPVKKQIAAYFAHLTLEGTADVKRLSTKFKLEETILRTLLLRKDPVREVKKRHVKATEKAAQK